MVVKVKFNHVGIFVENISNAIDQLKEIIIIKKKTSVIIDKKLGVKILFIIDNNNLCYELIEPYGKNNPVSNSLKKKINILNHIAYETKNFSKDIRKLIKSGYRPIIKPTKAKAFKGKKVIFLINKLNFIIEIIEK